MLQFFTLVKRVLWSLSLRQWLAGCSHDTWNVDDVLEAHDCSQAYLCGLQLCLV